MSLSPEQIDQVQAALAELRPALWHVQNIGLGTDGICHDTAARAEFMQRVLWPLIGHVWPLFESLAEQIARDAEAAGAAFESAEQLRANLVTVDTSMRLGWPYGLSAGLAMEQSFRWACAPAGQGDAEGVIEASLLATCRPSLRAQDAPPFHQ